MTNSARLSPWPHGFSPVQWFSERPSSMLSDRLSDATFPTSIPDFAEKVASARKIVCRRDLSLSRAVGRWENDSGWRIAKFVSVVASSTRLYRHPEGDDMVNTCSLLFLILVGAPAQENPPREFCEDDNRCTDDGLRIVFTESDDVTDFDEPAEIAILSSVLRSPVVGTEFTAIVVLDVVSEHFIEWSLGVAHDTGKIHVLEATARGLPLPPEFWLEVTDLAVSEQGQPAPGFVSFRSSCGIVGCLGALPVGPDQPVAYARYRVIATIDQTARVEFTDKLIPNPGSPPTATRLRIGSESKMPRVVVDGLIDSRVNRFRRGDLNGDQDVDLSDLIVLVRHLFLGGPLFFDCDNILDMNDDGVVDVSDPIALINWRFRGTFSLGDDSLGCTVDQERDLTCNESNCLEAQ